VSGGYNKRKSERIGAIMREVKASDDRAALTRQQSYDATQVCSVTVTLERRDGSAVRTVVGEGRGRRQHYEALRNAVAPFPAQTWRVVCISTPESIVRDLKGARGASHRAMEKLRLGQAGLREWI
jgi:hypothetical protein